MSRTPSEKLHRLIRSLSSAEKRYFSIFVNGKPGVDTKYIRLFEAMANAEHFDEEKWKTKIYKNQNAGSKNFAELKAYLYELVLKCLQNYDERHSTHHASICSSRMLPSFLSGVFMPIAGSSWPKPANLPSSTRALPTRLK